MKSVFLRNGFKLRQWYSCVLIPNVEDESERLIERSLRMGGEELTIDAVELGQWLEKSWELLRFFF